LSIRDSRTPEGGALQLTREGIADNDYAARWMADRGFPAPVVIAHSRVAACSASRMRQSIRKRPRWCCSPRFAAARARSPFPRRWRWQGGLVATGQPLLS